MKMNQAVISHIPGWKLAFVSDLIILTTKTWLTSNYRPGLS